MGIFLSKKLNELYFHEKKAISIEEFVNNKKIDNFDILKLTHPILNIIINKVDKKNNTKIKIYFPDFNDN